MSRNPSAVGSATVILDDAAIFERAAPLALFKALERTLGTSAVVPARQHYALDKKGSDSLILMPAWRDDEGLGVKILTVMTDNAKRGHASINGLYVLLDRSSGVPRAVMDAAALTLVRTAAVSGLSTSWLARPDADTLLMVGTGALAPHLVRAHCAARPLKRVLVWGRHFEKAAALARQLKSDTCEVEAVSDLRQATAQAAIISCATASDRPLVRGADVRPGTHVDLVGSFKPAMRETDSELFRRGRLVVDTLAAFEESGDLIAPVREGLIEARAPTLANLVNGTDRRRDLAEITIFKAVGTALADLAVAEHLFICHL